MRSRALDTVTVKSFNSYSIYSIIVTKQKQAVENETVLEYKVDTGSKSNIVPVKMFRILFWRTTMAELDS